MTRNTPATPLPWHDMAPATEMMRTHLRETNLAYATHAVNAYPRLVAALHDYIFNTDKSSDECEGDARTLLRELGEDA